MVNEAGQIMGDMYTPFNADFNANKPHAYAEVCDMANNNVVKSEGSASLFVEPDVIEFYIKLDFVRDTAEELRNSISKRIEYILQVVKSKVQGDKNISVHELMDKRDDQFCMSAEVLVKCGTLHKYEEIRSILVEKLGGMIYISDPRHYHSHRCLQDARLKVLRMAMSSARTKAMELASLFQKPLGPAVMVLELESSEKPPPQLDDLFISAISLRMYAPSRVVTSRLKVVFELMNSKPDKQSQYSAESAGHH